MIFIIIFWNFLENYIPAVINSILVPEISLRISSKLSSAEVLPTSGFEPAPSPDVIFFPNWIFLFALLNLSACASVLAARNSTPKI